MPFIRSISGVRATLGDALTPSLVADYTAAFAAYLPEGTVVVGRDGRPSGHWIEHVVCGTLVSCGRNVMVLGLASTPTVQLFAAQTGVAGGIAITASHNPAPWNGLKFFNGRGLYLNAQENQVFWGIVDELQTPSGIGSQQNERSPFVATQHGGSLTHITTGDEYHIKAILSLPLFSNDVVAKIQQRRLRVVVDAVNCSGSHSVPRLLEHLGCHVEPLYCDASGVFPHTPEPLPEHLSDLCAAVVKRKADIGIAVDPDADRLVLVDERGKTVREEMTIVLATLAVLSNQDLFRRSFTVRSEESNANNTNNTEQPPVVINLSTTRAVEDVAARFGYRTIRTAVGEINVVAAMLDCGSLIGGEGSGGVIMPACHAGRDALVGIALVLLALAQTDESTLSALLASLPQYAMVKHKQELPASANAATLESIFDAVRKQCADAEVNTIDGLRLAWKDRWVHLRTSNTEPIIRAIAEAPTLEQAESLVQTCIRAMEQHV